jgi:hypothetical protein
LSAVSIAITSLVKVPLKRVQIQGKGEELILLLPHHIDQELQHGHLTKIFEITLS